MRSLAFIVSIGFYLPCAEKLRIDSLRPSTNYAVIGKRKKSNFPNLERSRVTLGKKSEWQGLEQGTQPGMLIRTPPHLQE